MNDADAAAILSCMTEQACFMSDESTQMAVYGAKLKYNMKEYRELWSKLKQKCDRMNEEDDRRGEWNVRDLERALWTSSHTTSD
jgi:hypothetical protein